uniref:Ribosomal protein L6 n=1 Tax=Proschkinia sp. SZCZR1824 TaxID=2588390 RepID=A0A4Y5SG23_9STRA|nr:ribosomal protein L6 [Proschkinia sp. SZCZR1824]
MKNQKYVIKISNNIIALYSREKSILTIIGPLRKKSIFLKYPVILIVRSKTIEIKSKFFSKLPNYKKQKIRSLKGNVMALIQQIIVETSYLLYVKLKLFGIGYRAYLTDQFDQKLLSLKLGHSHSIFFKSVTDTRIFCLKKTKLFVYGHSYNEITKIASKLRAYKKPEPYKGKGILYEYETIKLKEGKKV